MSKAVVYSVTAGGIMLLAALAASFRLPELLSDTTRGMLCGFGVGLLIGTVLWARKPCSDDTATPAVRRRYVREFVPAATAYAFAILLSTSLLEHVDAVPLRIVIALLPVPAIALALRAVVRYVRDTDEMQQRIELEALSLATACVSLLYLTGSFLQSGRLIDVPSSVAMAFMFPLVCVAYAIVKSALVRRYT